MGNFWKNGRIILVPQESKREHHPENHLDASRAEGEQKMGRMIELIVAQLCLYCPGQKGLCKKYPPSYTEAYKCKGGMAEGELERIMSHLSSLKAREGNVSKRLAKQGQGEDMILLSDEKILEIRQKTNRIARNLANDTKGNFAQDDMDAIYEEGDRAIAKAQAKKVLFEMELYCDHDTPPLPRRKCPYCWQQLRKEIEC